MLLGNGPTSSKPSKRGAVMAKTSPRQSPHRLPRLICGRGMVTAEAPPRRSPRCLPWLILGKMGGGQWLRPHLIRVHGASRGRSRGRGSMVANIYIAKAHVAGQTWWRGVAATEHPLLLLLAGVEPGRRGKKRCTKKCGPPILIVLCLLDRHIYTT